MILVKAVVDYIYDIRESGLYAVQPVWPNTPGFLARYNIRSGSCEIIEAEPGALVYTQEGGFHALEGGLHALTPAGWTRVQSAPVDHEDCSAGVVWADYTTVGVSTGRHSAQPSGQPLTSEFFSETWMAALGEILPVESLPSLDEIAEIAEVQPMMAEETHPPPLSAEEARQVFEDEET